ncbi:hypothetical protein [Herbidospora daliensis]|uniref:hypothetical protein n=1 Tax=Herbidospora daliensis TaxID=295585 RepID=UPI0012F7BD79|nr:hypothetical protein [Herbidospora daliensis]
MAVSRGLDSESAYLALGDAIVRLDRASDDDVTPVFWCMELDNDALTDGAFRAMAMLRMVPDGDAIGRIIDFVDRRESYDMLRFWPAAAAAGWPREVVGEFLEKCAAGISADLAETAKSSLAGEYRNHHIL